MFKIKAALEAIKNKNKQAKLRITNDTVADVRQAVIRKGKKFKYPIQYERKKIIRNALVIVLISLLGVVFLTWWGLYRANSDSLVLFKLSQYLPLEVGNIDGEAINYSDYLAQYRSSMHWYQLKESDAKQPLDLMKAQFRKTSFENAAMIALANKISRERGLLVSQQEIQDELDLIYKSNQLSAESLDEIARDNYGLSSSEYRRFFIKNALLLRKVSFALDEEALELSRRIGVELSTNNDLRQLASRHASKVVFSESENIDRNKSDNGQIAAALKLKVGEVSPVFASFGREGYYFVKLLSKDDSSLRYQSLLVPLRRFDHDFQTLKNANKLSSYAKIDLTIDPSQIFPTN